MISRRCGADIVRGSGSEFLDLLSEAILMAPSFTIRGGTTEIIRSVIQRGLVQR
jgi:hypothetical protein